MMFMKAIPGFKPSDQAFVVSKETFDSLVAVVKRAMTAKIIVEASPIETTTMIWATLHGWVSLELLGMGFAEDNDAVFERLSPSLLRGLAP